MSSVGILEIEVSQRILGREESLASRALEEWELREEIFWKQKARVDWLQEGDRNAAFFHKIVQSCRHQSNISSLVNFQGIQLNSLQALFQEATRYFSTLFSEDSPCADNEENIILSCIPSLYAHFLKKKEGRHG